MSTNHCVITQHCFPFPGTEMTSENVFRMVEAFKEHYNVWSDVSRDSQGNMIQLFNPNGVLTGFESQNLHFCWFATSTSTGKKFRGVIDCICNGTSVDCRHTLYRVFDDGDVKSVGEMCYVWFKKWGEKFPAEAAKATWVFDIVRGDLSQEAIQVLRSMQELPFSKELLGYDSIEPEASADAMEWDAAAAPPPEAVVALPEATAALPEANPPMFVAASPEAVVDGMAVETTHAVEASSEAEAAMVVEAPPIPDELAAPPGYPGTYAEDCQSSLFLQLIDLNSKEHVNKALKGVWEQYGKAKEDGSIKATQVETNPEQRLKDAKDDETPVKVNGRGGGGGKKKATQTSLLSVEEAAEVWQAFNLYIAIFYRHELELNWVLGGAPTDVPHVVTPYQLPWMASPDCPSMSFYQDVGAGYCCWYTATVPAALALNCTLGEDGNPRVPVDYQSDDCFGTVFSMYWAKAFQELLLAHAYETWDTDMPLEDIPVKKLFTNQDKCPDTKKKTLIRKFADEEMPEGENIWRLAADYVFRTTTRSPDFPCPLVLCFHSFTGVCHPNTRFYDCPRPCLFRHVAEQWPLAYQTFLKSLQGSDFFEETDVPVPDGAMLAFVPIVQYMCKGTGIHTFTKAGQTLRNDSQGNIFHFSLLCRSSLGSFNQINEFYNVTNMNAVYRHVEGAKQIQEEEEASPSVSQGGAKGKAKC